MLAENEPCGKRQKREYEQSEQEKCLSSCPLLPESGNQTKTRKSPEQPTGINDFREGFDEYLWRSTRSNHAAILPRIVDRPKPESIQHADAPEQEAGDAVRNNRSETEDQISPHKFFQ